MLKNHWFVTRPKRKLIIVPELIKVFSAVAVGKKWRGNRALHKEFEEQLVSFQWKAQNLSQDGSGSRTYAVLLSMLGLWYEDAEGVKLTNAGQELVRDDPSVPILTKQLLNFQYPSPYAEGPRVGVSPEFRIQPYTFMCELLLSEGVTELSQDELAFCVIPYAQTGADLNGCIARIQRFRDESTDLISQAVADSAASIDNLRNIANTFINQIEYTGYFLPRDNPHDGLRLKPDSIERVRQDLDQVRKPMLSKGLDPVTFQKRFGGGLTISKDYAHTTPISPTINPTDRLILLAYYQIVLNKPLPGITPEVISEIAGLKGVPYTAVEKVLTKFASQPMMDRFEDSYIQISKGGKETATDFEVKTTAILSEDGFGFAAKWVGPSPRHPDIFLYLDHADMTFGMIDTKAYQQYTLPLDHKNKMASTYVPLYREISYEGKTYKLAFFNYVAGGYGSGMKRSFEELKTMTDVAGSYITAYNFMRLLRLHRERSFSAAEFREIFSCGGEIEYDKVSLVRSN